MIDLNGHEGHYKKEVVECSECGFQYLCEPSNPSDLCECPECKRREESK